ncbi:MAG: DUF4249 domain-containing protein [Saprospiraceae bacterium]|nr:DUF4249 domain-containing protein [Saprospiraceae bacterium]
MKNNILSHITLLVFGVLAASSCNLTKEVEIELPEYVSQPVVECYLEPGKPFRLLLSKSSPFFDEISIDSFAQKTLLSGALVTISYNGRTDTLSNQLSLEVSPLRVFNYTGQNTVPATPGTEYSLYIELPNGQGNISSRSIMLKSVPIDSVKAEFSTQADTLARVLTYITDDLNTEDYYRRLLNYSSLDSLPQQDFLVTDRFSTEPIIAFGTGYDVMRGDTVINTFFHISKDYYDFLESVQLAVIGNLNPFAQPSPIKSNVTGTSNPLGIFTCLAYDRKVTIIE